MAVHGCAWLCIKITRPQNVHLFSSVQFSKPGSLQKRTHPSLLKHPKRHALHKHTSQTPCTLTKKHGLRRTADILDPKPPPLGLGRRTAVPTFATSEAPWTPTSHPAAPPARPACAPRCRGPRGARHPGSTPRLSAESGGSGGGGGGCGGRIRLRRVEVPV